MPASLKALEPVFESSAIDNKCISTEYYFTTALVIKLATGSLTKYRR